MEREIQLSSRSAAALLAQIYGPAMGDFPRPGREPDLPGGAVLESMANPDRWYALMLNPCPAPPRERRVFALADAYIKEFIRLDRLGTMLGEEVARSVVEQSLQTAAGIAARCPDWPEWPEGWPVPPDHEPREQMTADELLVFGSLLLSASELIGLAPLRNALEDLSDDLLSLSMEPGSRSHGAMPRFGERVALRERGVVATAS